MLEMRLNEARTKIRIADTIPRGNRLTLTLDLFFINPVAEQRFRDSKCKLVSTNHYICNSLHWPPQGGIKFKALSEDDLHIVLEAFLGPSQSIR